MKGKIFFSVAAELQKPSPGCQQKLSSFDLFHFTYTFDG